MATDSLPPLALVAGGVAVGAAIGVLASKFMSAKDDTIVNAEAVGALPSASDKPIEFGYWNIRGLAQPIRLICEATGQRYVEKRYQQGYDPVGRGQGFKGTENSAWFDTKPLLKDAGLHFANLPYLVDGDIQITQSLACLRHIARKHDLLGKTEAEMATVDMLLDQAMDLRNAIVKVAYSGKDFDAQREAFVAKLPQMLDAFSRQLGDNAWFAGGAAPTAPDFFLYEHIEQCMTLEETKACVLAHKNIAEFLERFEAQDWMVRYRQKDAFLVKPINNTFAMWHGDGHEHLMGCEKKSKVFTVVDGVYQAEPEAADAKGGC